MIREENGEVPVLRAPNDEQKLAIEHQGGVLLSAGAGSGKTFVLVEHIIYLFRDFHGKNSGISIEEYAKNLKGFFSEIVLMTFTKKAAGELSLRLQNRFEQSYLISKAEKDPIKKQYWEEAITALPYLYVGTIHGFCHKLIAQGFVPGLSGEEELISDVEFKNKINGLLTRWFEANANKIRSKNLESLVLNKKSLLSSFQQIFSDTDLRILWSKKEPAKRTIAEEEEQAYEAFKISCGFDLKEFRYSCGELRPDDKKIPKWYELLEQLEDLIISGKRDLRFFSQLNESFSLVKTFPRKTKSTTPEGVEVLNKLKIIKDFCKKYGSYFDVLNSNFDKYKEWNQVIFDIYHYIEGEYLGDGTLTFTDLEYFVLKAVENKETAKVINQTYKYFIVDEFQDTSQVQFTIIKNIIQENMEKVFSVGDVKQAIYGFRGGELGVFKEAQENTYQNLSLANNYRSCGNVIEFNNSLFRYILPLGQEYVGEDDFSVPMVSQVVPAGKEDTGNLIKIDCEVETQDEELTSLSSGQINLLESKTYVNWVKHFLKEKELKEESVDICFLYRKLGPTQFLISDLIQESIGFTCQVKIDLNSDPLICLFLEFSRACHYCYDEKEFLKTYFSLKSLLSLLGREDLSEEALKSSAKRYYSFGLMDTFKSFLWEIGLSSSNLNDNWTIIKALNSASEDKANLVFEFKRSYVSGDYSLNFQYGKNPNAIKVMTTHASKGLEFDTVILGGIHTNGSSRSGGAFFGKVPFSSKWLSGTSRSSLSMSPAYIYEKELVSFKEFSEFKRLFYVATTRAVTNLIWADLRLGDKLLSYSKNSWINGIRSWEDDISKESIDIKAKISIVNETLAFEDFVSEETRMDLKVPMFHKDNLGIEISEEVTPELGLSSELSVTRFATIAQCPRKFFLKNVLKFNGDELEGLLEINDHSEENDLIDEYLNSKNIFEIDEETPFEQGSNKINPMERGILVHAELEHAVKHNFILPLESKLDKKSKEGCEWAISMLEEKFAGDDYLLVSEEPLKLNIFGQAISGTPDLQILPRKNDGVLEIWDYKTGTSFGKDLASYWLQLQTYALGLMNEHFSNSICSLKLVFIDEKKTYEQKFEKDELTDQVFKKWQLLSKPDYTNKDHCSKCDFSNLCRLEE